VPLQEDLIYDVGFHNGDDTAYYLHRGFRVVAIEANPTLVAHGSDRFKAEIAAGRLTLLNIGIAQTEGAFSFWVNEDNDTWSSFDHDIAGRKGTRIREVKVQGVPFSQILGKHGVPYYLKVDIEGSDTLCVPALARSDRPKYVSCELDLNGERGVVNELARVGYRHFKVINQTSFTESTPILEGEIAARVLRKACHKLPAVRSLLNRLPSRLRPKKIAFDSHLRKFAYQFQEGCSGPFGEDTYGPWHSIERITERIARIRHQLTKANGSSGRWWYDVHATW
jgi:FkbM family methyltransferase